MPLSRRKLILGGAAALTLPALLRAARLTKLSGLPDAVTAFIENESFALTRNGSKWTGQDLELGAASSPDAFDLTLSAPRSAVLRLHLRWLLEPAANLRYLADDWERSYGDLAWRGMDPERVMPWYFLAFDGSSTTACGVKIAPGAFCFWQVDPEGASLWLDVRNGGRGLQLGARQLAVASVVVKNYPQMKPFEAARRFCHVMSEKPKMPAAPVYGGNNWYYAYGKSSASDIRDDSERIASFAGSNANRPFMVIDEGWQPYPMAGPWDRGNARFPDLAELGASMRRIGVQPGIWVRPLFTKEAIPAGWRLNTPNAAREFSAHGAYTIDPTVPEALEKIRRDIRTAAQWGYRLIKHDFSTYDLLGRWGFNMRAEITDRDWTFADRTRSNAEIVRDFYQALRDAAGGSMLLGCNTIGHLTAGLFELQRTGDDTSGRDWNRTRKMGVNTLAFRAPQHGSFFAIDADCVGLTRDVPWSYNRQWLDLLARSGTPLFVSAAPNAIGPEQTAALKRAFALAAAPCPLAEPLDWMDNPEPQHWRLNGQAANFDWFGADGVSPFAG